MAFPIAFHSAESQERAMIWALTYSVLVCIFPALYIGFMVWRGHITDIHVRVREQRIRPFVVSVVCTAIAWTTLRWMGAPSLLPMFTLFSLIQLTVILLDVADQYALDEHYRGGGSSGGALRTRHGTAPESSYSHGRRGAYQIAPPYSGAGNRGRNSWGNADGGDGDPQPVGPVAIFRSSFPDGLVQNRTDTQLRVRW
jgi:hypothetical protein